jgi:hypothetical protein
MQQWKSPLASVAASYVNFVSHRSCLQASIVRRNGARCRFRTCDPYRVKVMLYR